MGIQIKGSNDTISAADGSMVLEGAALTFTNENITGISTMGTAVVTSGDLSVGVSTFFVDNSTGRIGIGTIGPYDGSLTVARNEASGYIASFRGVHTSNSAQIIIDSPADNNTRPSSIDLANAGTIKWSLGQAYASTSSGAFHIATSKLQSNDDGAKLSITTAGHVGIDSASPTATRFSGSVSGLLNLAGTKPCIYISETDSKDSGGVNKALYLGLSGGTVYCGSNANFTFATGDTTTSQRLKIDTSGNVSILTGNVGILTSDVNTEHIAGAASSFVGLYMNDGFIGFPTALNRDGGYFIATHVNALNAGPVSLGSSMTLHGTWTIV